MFWNFGISVSAIDQIFEREQPPTLNEVLEEPELMQEVKSQNDKLINFLTEEENIKKIIDYVINGDGIFRRKSHDILVSCVGIIDHTVFESPSSLESLWAVFQSNSEDVSILGHVVSIFTHYAAHKSAELFNFFIDNKIEFLQDIMLKLNYPPVCELMTRMVCNKMSDACSRFQDQFIQKNIVDKLINIMSMGNSPEIADGASAVIAVLLHNIRNDNVSEEASVFEISFTDTLFSDENMNLLVNNIITAQASPPISISGASTLSLILNLQRCGHANGDEFIAPSNIPARYIKCCRFIIIFSLKAGIFKLFSSEFFVRKLLHLSIQNQSYIAHVREIQRTLNLSITDSYHKEVILDKIEEFSDELKEALKRAKELLVGIDEIEKFLRAITDDFEIQDIFFSNDTTQDFISLEKDKMNLELDTLFPSDPFKHVNIQRTPLDYNIQPYDGIVEVVKESINGIVYPVSSPSDSDKNSFMETDQDIDVITKDINIQPNEPLQMDIDGLVSDFNNDSFSYENDELSTSSQDQLLDQDHDGLQKNCHTTSSPVLAGFDAILDQDADIFQEEIVSD
ncbi:hypothetical protein MXB_4763 [Myxobolus squamalis]|nr:hypothetical protein MXB_4763 [Myxobolus squamalis]